jgi:hypothetical protein
VTAGRWVLLGLALCSCRSNESLGFLRRCNVDRPTARPSPDVIGPGRISTGRDATQLRPVNK